MRRWRKENQVVAMGPKIAVEDGGKGVRCRVWISLSLFFFYLSLSLLGHCACLPPP